jgi:hypothetical protein
MLQWNAQQRMAEQKAARQQQHNKRLELFKQRSEWAAAAQPTSV